MKQTINVSGIKHWIATNDTNLAHVREAWMIGEENIKKRQQGDGRAYLLSVAVSLPTRARHRERHAEQGRGDDEDEEGMGGEVTVFASSEEICRLIQQLDALSPSPPPPHPTASHPHSHLLPSLLSLSLHDCIYHKPLLYHFGYTFGECTGQARITSDNNHTEGGR